MNNRKPILLLALLGLSASALAQQPNALAPMQSIYAQARPATVKIVTEDGFGSGFFYSQGYVLTAYHVVEGTSEVKLQTPDQQTLTAQTVGYAQSYDLAVLKVEGHVSAHFLGLDTQRSPEPGEWVLTIGSSRGELSAPRLGRIEDTRVNLSPLFPKDLVASSMPLAPGDSGGAVLDADGQVVGVAVAVGVDAAGQPHSYFVPLDGLGQLLQALAQGSSTRWPATAGSVTSPSTSRS